MRATRLSAWSIRMSRTPSHAVLIMALYGSTPMMRTGSPGPGWSASEASQRSAVLWSARAEPTPLVHEIVDMPKCRSATAPTRRERGRNDGDRAEQAPAAQDAADAACGGRRRSRARRRARRWPLASPESRSRRLNDESRADVVDSARERSSAQVQTRRLRSRRTRTQDEAAEFAAEPAPAHDRGRAD